MNTPRILQADRGSIPLALLAMIIAAGIVAALGAVMVVEVRNTRTNQSQQTAVQAADQGIQEAVFRANNLGNPGACTAGSPCTGTTGQGTYSWTAAANASGGWDVVSTGSVEGRSRTVTIKLDKMRRFPMAAFGDTGVELKGSNGADSYDSATGARNTGHGQIGSNGNINFNGASTTVDSVVLYNHDAANNTCNQNGAGTACSSVTTVGEKLDLASAANMKFIDDQIAKCEALAPLTTWQASKNAGRFIATGTPQCFESLVFDQDTEVTGNATIFVKTSVSFETGVKVNCASCAGGGFPQDAAKLQIFSAGTSDPNDSSNDTQTIAIGNQSYIGAAIYAPRAACLGNPSAAQADVYGALICGVIGRITSGNQGGWAFHYDDKLGNIGTGGYTASRWDEN